jgi:hypothetical protein
LTSLSDNPARVLYDRNARVDERCASSETSANSERKERLKAIVETVETRSLHGYSWEGFAEERQAS